MDKLHSANSLTKYGVKEIFHYAPLHFVLFILRRNALLSKESLLEEGFDESHFRSTSHKSDITRGFAEYVHLTNEKLPPILKAKLSSGFPHIALGFEASSLSDNDFHLCRYNIARTRYLRRPGSAGVRESVVNGKYYGAKQIPIAVKTREKENLIQGNLGKRMIEVLVKDKLDLSTSTRLIFFSEQDCSLVRESLNGAAIDFEQEIEMCAAYRQNARHFDRVRSYLNRASKERRWKGDGLEFDKV